MTCAPASWGGTNEKGIRDHMSRFNQGHQQRVFDPVLLAGQPQPSVMPLSERSIEFVFMCCCQSPTFLAEARLAIQPHHFDEAAETHFSILWKVLCQAADAYNATMTFETLAAMLDATLVSDGRLRAEVEYDLLRADQFGLLWSMINCPVQPMDLLHGRTVLRQFLHERAVVTPLRRFMAQGFNGSYAETLPNFLQSVQDQAERIQSMDVLPLVSVTPARGSAIEPPNVFNRTGIPWIDQGLGGQRVGDANGILGVTGGGKTTLAIHMAVESARTAWAEACESQQAPGLTIFITGEEEGKKITPRVQSAAFQISRRKLETLSDWGQLSTPGNLEAYERALGQVQGEQLSEVERYDIGCMWLSKTFELLDFSGSEKFPHAGEGYITEMVGMIDRIQQRTQQPIRSIFIDWAGTLCRRYMDANNMDDSRLRHLLSAFGANVRRQLAERFRCTAWIMHQVKAESCDKSPTKLMHHTDSAECKAFAVELSVCGCIGVPDQATGCRYINWSKVRYVPTHNISPSILRINDTFASIDEVSHRYGVDETGLRFVTQEDLRQLAGTEATHERRAVMSGPPGMRRDMEPQNGQGTAASGADLSLLDNF